MLLKSNLLFLFVKSCILILPHFLLISNLFQSIKMKLYTAVVLLMLVSMAIASDLKKKVWKCNKT